MTDFNNKNTAEGKALRTMLQAFIAIAPVFIGIVALPEVQVFIQDHLTWLLPLLAPVIAIVTFLYNRLEGQK